MIRRADAADRIDATPARARLLRIVHLFPDLLSVYGDSGNIRTLVVRAEARGIAVERTAVLAETGRLPSGDLFVIGGGQDRDQVQVEQSLRRIGDALVREVGEGAAVLAVCGGFQSLGVEYRVPGMRTIQGPGVLDVRTVGGPKRLVGPVVAHLEDPLFDSVERTIVGFENHSGRTTIGPDSRPLARVEIGHGNDDDGGTEGVLETPGSRGLLGLRVGTYLHGPLLPRNPHITDVLIAAGLSRTGQPIDLEPLDDRDEWVAHRHYVQRCRKRPWTERLPGQLRRVVEPARNLIGF
jgi:lipid II isoglutaminyl synthase (glutamine-hydrolysing)